MNTYLKNLLNIYFQVSQPAFIWKLLNCSNHSPQREQLISLLRLSSTWHIVLLWTKNKYFISPYLHILELTIEPEDNFIDPCSTIKCWRFIFNPGFTVVCRVSCVMSFFFFCMLSACFLTNQRPLCSCTLIGCWVGLVGAHRSYSHSKIRNVEFAGLSTWLMLPFLTSCWLLIGVSEFGLFRTCWT